jgi:hypothetical protein
MKQTAVEWLVEQLKSQYGLYIDRFAVTDKTEAMEKEQIKEAHSAGQESAYGFRDKETAEEYYQKTYGKKE